MRALADPPRDRLFARRDLATGDSRGSMPGENDMRTDHHETLVERGTVEGPSDRSFGLTVGGIFAALGLIRSLLRWDLDITSVLMLVVGATLLTLTAISPKSLGMANRIWMRFGALLPGSSPRWSCCSCMPLPLFQSASSCGYAGMIRCVRNALLPVKATGSTAHHRTRW